MMKTPFGFCVLVCLVLLGARQAHGDECCQPRVGKSELIQLAVEGGVKVILQRMEQLEKGPLDAQDLLEYSKLLMEALLSGKSIDDAIQMLFAYCKTPKMPTPQRKQKPKPTKAPEVIYKELLTTEEETTTAENLPTTQNTTKTPARLDDEVDPNDQAAEVTESPPTQPENPISYMCQLEFGKEKCYRYRYNLNKSISIEE